MSLAAGSAGEVALLQYQAIAASHPALSAQLSATQVIYVFDRCFPNSVFYAFDAWWRYQLNPKGSGEICSTRLVNCSMWHVYSAIFAEVKRRDGHAESLTFPGTESKIPSCLWLSLVKIKCFLRSSVTHAVTFGICDWPRRHQKASRVWYSSPERWRRASKAERDLSASNRINSRAKTSWAARGCMEMNRGGIYGILRINKSMEDIWPHLPKYML